MTAKCLLGVVLIAAVATVGCGVQTIRVQRMKPAEVNLAPYKTIAVAGIGGPGGDAFADVLTQKLFDSGRFQVVDSQSSQATITGQVTRRDYTENTTQSQATCYSGKQQYACTNYQTTGRWAFNVGLKVIDTATGQIVATKALTVGDQKTVEATDALPATNWDPETVFEGLQQIQVARFMQVIAPYPVSTDVKLFTTGDLPELERGTSFAKSGDWSDATEQFKSACARADQSADVKPKVRARCHYNLGVAYGYSGQYDEADAELKRATALNSEDVFLQEASRIRGFKIDDERLRQQGAQ